MTPQNIAITVNGEQRALAHGDTLAHLVSDLTGKQLGADGSPADGSNLGVAAAVDGIVVPRSGWAKRSLENGQSIDIVTAVQGG